MKSTLLNRCKSLDGCFARGGGGRALLRSVAETTVSGRSRLKRLQSLSVVKVGADPETLETRTKRLIGRYRYN